MSLKTLVTQFFLWPITLGGFIYTYNIYKQLDTDLTYRQWAQQKADAWVAAGRPRGESFKSLREELEIKKAQ